VSNTVEFGQISVGVALVDLVKFDQILVMTDSTKFD